MPPAHATASRPPATTRDPAGSSSTTGSRGADEREPGEEQGEPDQRLKGAAPRGQREDDQQAHRGLWSKVGTPLITIPAATAAAQACGPATPEHRHGQEQHGQRVHAATLRQQRGDDAGHRQHGGRGHVLPQAECAHPPTVIPAPTASSSRAIRDHPAGMTRARRARVTVWPMSPSVLIADTRLCRTRPAEPLEATPLARPRTASTPLTSLAGPEPRGRPGHPAAPAPRAAARRTPPTRRTAPSPSSCSRRSTSTSTSTRRCGGPAPAASCSRTSPGGDRGRADRRGRGRADRAGHAGG